MYATLYTAFDQKYQAAVAGAAGLTANLSDPLLALVTLYVVIWGYLVMTGKVQEFPSDLVGRVLRIAIIAALVTNVATYNTYVGTFFLNTLPCWMLSQLGGVTCSGNVDSVGATLAASADTLFTMGMKGGGNALSGFSFYSGASWVALIVAVLGIFAAAIASVVVFFEITLVLVVLQIVVLVGPLFIGLALFDQTSHFFKNWVGKLAHSMVEVLLLAIATQVLTTMLGLNLQVNASSPVTAALAATIAILVGMGLFLVVPSLASALTGGGGSLTGAMVAASGSFRSWRAASASSAAVTGGGLYGGGRFGVGRAWSAARQAFRK